MLLYIPKMGQGGSDSEMHLLSIRSRGLPVTATFMFRVDTLVRIWKTRFLVPQ